MRDTESSVSLVPGACPGPRSGIHRDDVRTPAFAGVTYRGLFTSSSTIDVVVKYMTLSKVLVMTPIYQRPAEILQKLIRFNTTNPPGNEKECIAYIADLLAEGGIEYTIAARSPDRPNLVGRIPGAGNAAPLLLQGHVDVVTAEKQDWQHPPFEGREVDGVIWGRGALDMKGGIAMMLAAALRAKAEGVTLRGDVVLAIMSDEESFGNCGAKYLVENHANLFAGIKYAIGELGGFSLYLDTKKFYPIMVAEKQFCWIKATVRGPGGHGSLPVRGGAVEKLSQLLGKFHTSNLPVHVTPAARLMIASIASSLGGMKGFVLNQLTNPLLTDGVLKLLGERGRTFYPLLRNTVSPTVLHGSNKINVIPGEASVEMDGRLLPGFSPDDLIRELRAVTGDGVCFEVLQYDPGPPEPDMGLFGVLSDILKELDPDGIPVPLLLSATTDARCFAKLGIQTYGFIPMKLPEGFDFTKMIHAANERIPIEAVAFGADAIFRLLQRF